MAARVIIEGLPEYRYFRVSSRPMHFLTPAECREWCGAARLSLDDHGIPLQPQGDKTAIPTAYTALLGFCQKLEQSLRPYRECLLWVTESTIWDSGVNWHLYYRLRQSYGDQRRIDDAPGHLFLQHEMPDMVSFSQIAILSGFDAYYLTDATGNQRAFLSHDEYVILGAR